MSSEITGLISFSFQNVFKSQHNLLNIFPNNHMIPVSEKNTCSLFQNFSK